MIVNCLVRWNGGIVMLRKPRRGWWVLPGGKVEEDELWPEAAAREVLEETGLTVEGLTLRGIYLHKVLGRDGEPPLIRTIAQFSAAVTNGSPLFQSKEGLIGTVMVQDIEELPMDEGDKRMLHHTLLAEQSPDAGVVFGRFVYTSDHHLTDWHVDFSDMPSTFTIPREENPSL